MHKSGFTFIELVIVATLLGILTLLLFGAVKKGGFGSRESVQVLVPVV